MRTSDLVAAMFIFALSALVLFGSWTFAYWSDTAPGPAFLPRWLVAAGVLLGILQLIEMWRGDSSREDDAAAWPDRAALARVALTFGGLVAVPVLSPVVGMVPMLILYVAFLLLVVLRQPVGPSLAAVAITGGVIYGIFVVWLGLPLPKGGLGF